MAWGNRTGERARNRRALALAATALVCAPPANAHPSHYRAAAVATKPANGDWTRLVTETAQGGYVMGNPSAKVHIVELGSLSCSHCAAFSNEFAPKLIARYVKPGQITYEFRNYVRDPYDIAASLIVRCNGAKSFFPLTEAMFKDQSTWIARLGAIPPNQLQSLQDATPAQEFLTVGKWAGFPTWAANHGIPEAKAEQCLSNTREVDRLVQMRADASNRYDIPGTPTFLINGKVVDLGNVTETEVWPALEAKIRDSLGERDKRSRFE